MAACAAEDPELGDDSAEAGSEEVGGSGGGEAPDQAVACELPAERFDASFLTFLNGTSSPLDCAQLSSPNMAGGPGMGSYTGYPTVVLSSGSPEEGKVVLTLADGSTLTATAPGLRALPPAGTFVEIYAGVTEDPNFPGGCRKELAVVNLPAFGGIPNPTTTDSSFWFAGNVERLLTMLNVRASPGVPYDPSDEKIFSVAAVPEPGCAGDADGCAVPAALELTPPGAEPLLVGLGETRALTLPEGHPLAGEYEVRNLASAMGARWYDFDETCMPAADYWIQRR